MISYLQSLELLQQNTKPLSSETLSLSPANYSSIVGRISSADVFSRLNLPSFDNSAMDGFAVQSALTNNASKENPVFLPVAECIAAGDAPTTYSAKSMAIEIMTGAPMPKAYSTEWELDSVVKVEDVQRDEKGIWLTKPVPKGSNVRKIGEDFRENDLVLPKGCTLGPEHIMILATHGITEIQVVRRPRVVIINTGSELQTDGTLKEGKIHNSSGPFLIAALKQQNCEVIDLGVVSDDPTLFSKTLTKAISQSPDVILSTGAVSAGKFDFVKSVLLDHGAHISFHKVAIRPGKPVLFAKLNGTAFFGMPGNPLSTFVGLRFFVNPYLRGIQGRRPELPLKLKLASEAKKPDGLRAFFKGKILDSSVSILPGQASFMVSPLIESNCWVQLPETGAKIFAGTEVDVFPLFDTAKETFL